MLNVKPTSKFTECAWSFVPASAADFAFALFAGLRHQTAGNGILQKLLFVMAITPVFSGVGAFAAAFVHNNFAQAAQVFGCLEVVWGVSSGHGGHAPQVKFCGLASRPKPNRYRSLHTKAPACRVVAA